MVRNFTFSMVVEIYDFTWDKGLGAAASVVVSLIVLFGTYKEKAPTRKVFWVF